MKKLRLLSEEILTEKWLLMKTGSAVVRSLWGCAGDVGKGGGSCGRAGDYKRKGPGFLLAAGLLWSSTLLSIFRAPKICLLTKTE